MSKVQYSFKVEADLLKEMKKLAIEKDMNLNDLLVEAYKTYIVVHDVEQK